MRCYAFGHSMGRWAKPTEHKHNVRRADNNIQVLCAAIFRYNLLLVGLMRIVYLPRTVVVRSDMTGQF